MSFDPRMLVAGLVGILILTIVGIAAAHRAVPPKPFELGQVFDAHFDLLPDAEQILRAARRSHFAFAVAIAPTHPRAALIMWREYRRIARIRIRR